MHYFYDILLELYDIILYNFYINDIDGISKIDEIKEDKYISYDQKGNIEYKEEYVLYT